MFLWLLTFYQTGPNGLFIFYQVFNLILQSADKFQRRIFPQFKINELELFPVPKMDKNIQSKIASLVKVIINKVKNKTDYSKENKDVDELVMMAFELSEDEKESVRKFEF